MNIVLLSGGSGKRLWPLSNDIKSKQFIRLFKRDDCVYESMLERVYRQIKGIDSSSCITIATTEVQVPFIKAQLGDNVSISIEPSRRDTFPAIVLSSLFLLEKLKVERNEPVIVCPVDPYVDDSYYSAFKNLEKIVRKGKFNLTLMGITPTYPSEKYGYIIPQDREKISKVLSFKEKPDERTARKYIESGALWNAGVFAFKLGYLIDIAHRYIDFIGYDDLYQKYPTLEKISFDYAVVEKEKDISVFRYDGRWEDVGTWNTLSDVLEDDAIGNIIEGEGNHNLTIINRLEIPILSMGCIDMVVVASDEGVLVSSKDCSSRIKSYVDKLSEEGEKRKLFLINRDDSSRLYRLKLEKDKTFNYESDGDFVINVVEGEGFFIKDEKISFKRGDTLKGEKGKYIISSTTRLNLVILVIDDQGGR